MSIINSGSQGRDQMWVRTIQLIFGSCKSIGKSAAAGFGKESNETPVFFQVQEIRCFSDQNKVDPKPIYKSGGKSYQGKTVKGLEEGSWPLFSLWCGIKDPGCW